jgi:hypothetical protein
MQPRCSYDCVAECHSGKAFHSSVGREGSESYRGWGFPRARNGSCGPIHPFAKGMQTPTSMAPLKREEARVAALSGIGLPHYGLHGAAAMRHPLAMPTTKACQNPLVFRPRRVSRQALPGSTLSSNDMPKVVACSHAFSCSAESSLAYWRGKCLLVL